MLSFCIYWNNCQRRIENNHKILVKLGRQITGGKCVDYSNMATFRQDLMIFKIEFSDKKVAQSWKYGWHTFVVLLYLPPCPI